MPDFHTLNRKFLAINCFQLFTSLRPPAFWTNQPKKEVCLAFRYFAEFGAIKTAKQIFQKRPISSAAAKIVDLVMLCKLLFLSIDTSSSIRVFFYSFSFVFFFLFVSFHFFSIHNSEKKRIKLDEFGTQTVITPRKKNSLISLPLFSLASSFRLFAISKIIITTAQQMSWILMLWIYHLEISAHARILTSTNGNQALHLVHFGFYVGVRVGVCITVAPFFSTFCPKLLCGKWHRI